MNDKLQSLKKELHDLPPERAPQENKEPEPKHPKAPDNTPKDGAGEQAAKEDPTSTPRTPARS